jgi:hypothetical protein
MFAKTTYISYNIKIGGQKKKFYKNNFYLAVKYSLPFSFKAIRT